MIHACAVERDPFQRFNRLIDIASVVLSEPMHTRTLRNLLPLPSLPSLTPYIPAGRSHSTHHLVGYPTRRRSGTRHAGKGACTHRDSHQVTPRAHVGGAILTPLVGVAPWPFVPVSTFDSDKTRQDKVALYCKI
eukprot:COSAG02_NODE_3315_length_6950_cov_190.190629_4_plen_134_part_00